MRVKRLLMVLLPFLALLILPCVQAATITVCTFDRDVYNQGETGCITVTIYNDEETKIKVTELTATINYYHTDGTVYIQKFYANSTLPAEIQQGTSSIFDIPFRLPANIASGYTSVSVKAITELWNPMSEIWFASEHPTYQPLLYIESPYKEQLEDQQSVNEHLEDQLDEQQSVNEQLEGQLEELQAINKNATDMMYLFGMTTIVFAGVAGLLFLLYRRARVFTQPIV